MKRILFRADASNTIGYGHVYRLIALIDILKSHYQCVFVSHVSYPFLSDYLYKNKIDFIKVKQIEYSLPDLKKLDEEILFDMEGIIQSGDFVVLDGYWFGINFQSRIQFLGARIILIDDINANYENANLVINPSPSSDISLYNSNNKITYALGINYAILRKPFLDNAKMLHKKNATIKKGSVLVCFGGSDYKNLTLSVLNIITKISLFNHIHVVTGPGYSHLEMLKNSFNLSSVSFFHNISDQELADLMFITEFAIVPASNILLESMASGLKILSGYYANNQFSQYNNFLKNNLIVPMGSFSSQEISQGVSSLYLSPESPINLVDGQSDERILSLFKQL